ncbi:MAG: hypothetical protein NTZ50_03710 [Chloroflexi bacterium]|nr:hypothetical protein [Chloroflexota bacterium]
MRYRWLVPMCITVSFLFTACSAAVPAGVPQLEPTRTRAPDAMRSTASGAARAAFTAAAATPQLRAQDLAACAQVDLGSKPTVFQSSRAVGHIYLLDNGGNLALMRPDGSEYRALTRDAFIERTAERMRTYRFPAASPDGARVAFVRVDVSSAGVTQTVQTATFDGSKPVHDVAVVVNRNVPYVDWSPDSRLLAFLDLNGLQGAIRLVSSTGGPVVDVQAGAPAYWHWRPDSRVLLTHTGGRAQDVQDEGAVSVVAVDASPDAASLPHVRSLAVLPGQFQAPQYSPDGRHTLYAANVGPSDLLIVGDADGVPQCVLTRLQVNAYFAWSPDGVHVAMLDVMAPAAEVAMVRVFDVRDGSSRTVHRDALMFFWSPDGRCVLKPSTYPTGTSSMWLICIRPSRSYSTSSILISIRARLRRGRRMAGS